MIYNSYFGFRAIPFGVTPDANLFYSNSVYQEAFASLTYGIQEKKGFMLLTGEAGTGKTTLLRKLIHSLDTTVQSAFIHNTSLSFTELLQLTLWELNVAAKQGDKVAMLEQLNGYLIEQLKNNCTVVLMVDEAQNLSDETLESVRLLSNLETGKQKLLQVLLVGQPELERKLDQPHLRQLKQRVALRCRLLRLKSLEVGPYISFRLQMAGYKGDNLFHSDAIVWVASYSKGIPRLINIICDNALLIAYAGTKQQVGAEIIHEVARDLRLGEPPRPKQQSEPGAFRIGREQQPSFFGPRDDVDSGLGRAISEEREMRNAGRPGHRRPAWRAPLTTGFVFALVLFGAGTMFYRLQPINYLSDLALKMNEYFDSQEEEIERANRSQEVPQNELSNATADVLTQPALEPTLSPEDKSQEGTAVVQAEESREPQASAPTTETSESAGPRGFLPRLKTEQAPELPSAESGAQTASKPPEEVATSSERQDPIQISEDPEVRRRKIQIEIYRAIQNRAVAGVNAALIDGIAYLHGEVATERQKLAAEQAARSVSGVDDVRNRIVVK